MQSRPPFIRWWMSNRCPMIRGKTLLISQLTRSPRWPRSTETIICFNLRSNSVVPTTKMIFWFFTSPWRVKSRITDESHHVLHHFISEPENIAYLIDLYTYSHRAEKGEPPHHIGYHYLLPNQLKKSEGQLELPITCASKHRPLGMMRIEFVKTTPLNDPRCDMKVICWSSFSLNLLMILFQMSYIRYWNEKKKGLDVGHRGSGTSFKVTSSGAIRENTIASLKKAGESGADFVEFDVSVRLGASKCASTKIFFLRI